MSFYTFFCPSLCGEKILKKYRNSIVSKVRILKWDNWYYFHGLAFKWNLFRGILMTSKTFTMVNMLQYVDKYVAIRFPFSWRNILSFVTFLLTVVNFYCCIFCNFFFLVNPSLLHFNTISQVTDTKVRGKVSFLASVQGQIGAFRRKSWKKRVNLRKEKVCIKPAIDCFLLRSQLNFLNILYQHINSARW